MPCNDCLAGAGCHRDKVSSLVLADPLKIKLIKNLLLKGTCDYIQIGEGDGQLRLRARRATPKCIVKSSGIADGVIRGKIGVVPIILERRRDSGDDFRLFAGGDADIPFNSVCERGSGEVR